MQKMVVLLSMLSVHSPILISYCLNGVHSRFQFLFGHSIHFTLHINLNLPQKIFLDLLGKQTTDTQEGINQRNMKNWADVADKISFGRT